MPEGLRTRVTPVGRLTGGAAAPRRLPAELPPGARGRYLGRHAALGRCLSAAGAFGQADALSGHPVFVAQHATTTCCRGCLAKWHGIPKGRELTAEEQAHVLAAIQRWLLAQQRA